MSKIEEKKQRHALVWRVVDVTRPTDRYCISFIFDSSPTSEPFTIRTVMWGGGGNVKTEVEEKIGLNAIWTFLLSYSSPIFFCPVGWGCRIHRLHLCRGVTPPQTVAMDMTLNNLMVRFQWCLSFGKCGALLHCHCSQVHSGPEWEHLMGPKWVK